MAAREADPSSGELATDRVMSIDAGGIKYFTGHPGVVSTNDSIETEQAIATAYDVRWLVLERSSVATSMIPVLGGQRPPWIGVPVFTVPSTDGTEPILALYPVCVTAGDTRCGSG
jgi:hypothetical protein